MSKIKVITSKEFQTIFKKVPRLCVEVIVKDKRGVLLSKRKIRPWQGQWHFPGGTVRFGETLRAAVKRIALDETGLQVSIRKILGPIEFLKSDEGLIHVVSLGCLVKVQGGKLRGSWQGEQLEFFKRLPTGAIKQQAEFIKLHKLLMNL